MRALGYFSMPEVISYRAYKYSDQLALKNQKFEELLKSDCANYNFFQDIPFNYQDNYKKILEIYPNAKFILSIRDPNSWFDSCVSWMNLINGHAVYKDIWGCDFTEKNKQEIVEKYNRRNYEIENYFDSDRLLILQLESFSLKRLVSFLGIKLDMQESDSFNQFPWDNKSDGRGFIP